MGSQRFHAAIEEYSLLGIDTFPLVEGTKIPAVSRWQLLTPNRLWLRASPDSNVAIRCGGVARVAVIDCDEKNFVGTFTNVLNYLGSLGYAPDEITVVQTASGIGRHIYVEFVGVLDRNYRVLAPAFGAGEFRYGLGSYVAAVPSIIDGSAMKLLSGDFRQLIRLDLQDVFPMLGNQQVGEISKPLQVPRRTLAMLKGIGLEGYKSRSEAEQAIVVGLINAGFDFEGVLAKFQEHEAAGKFHELNQKKPKLAKHYLELSYEKALEFVNQNESKARRFTETVLTWAESQSWPGQTGSVDRAVFMAHAQIAHRSARREYAASVRELAEIAGCGLSTIVRANKRLIEANLLTLAQPATADLANIYRLNLAEQSGTLPQPKDVRKCSIMFQHDAFRHGGGLGKSGYEVYEQLLRHPATTTELASSTGRHIKTVQRVLERMSEKLIDVTTGEIVRMVENDGELWHGLEVDLDHVAEIVGTAGTLEKQQRKHQQERARHRQDLLRGKLKNS